MKKNIIRKYVCCLLILGVFSIYSFVIPFSKTDVFWLGFIFGVIAILIQLFFVRIAFSKEKNIKSKLYGIPIAKIGVIYLITQIIISIIEMATSKFILMWIALIVNIVLLVATLLGTITSEVIKEELVRQDFQMKNDVENLRELQSKIVAFVDICHDMNVKKQLQELADEFKYSDPVSSNDTKEIEEKLKSLLNEIQKELQDENMESVSNLCLCTKDVLIERNRLCKVGKMR